MKFIVVILTLFVSLVMVGPQVQVSSTAPGTPLARPGAPEVRAVFPMVEGPSTTCSTTPCANGAPVQWYTGSPWGSTQFYTLPSRDDGELFDVSPGDSICPGNITGNPTNVMASSSNVCFVGMQTFPIYFATSPASGNLLTGQYTMNIGSDDGSSLYLDSFPSIGPGALETSVNYNMVVGSPAGGGYGSPSSWTSTNGNLVAALDGGFSYIHVAYEECCGGPYALSYWLYTNQSDAYGAGLTSLRGTGPGTTQTYFPQAVLTGTVTCTCGGTANAFANVPLTITANYGSRWTYNLHSSSSGDWGFDIPPSEFVGSVSDPYTISVTPPPGYMVAAATLNGSSVGEPVSVSVGPGFAATVDIQLEPILHSLAITPSSAAMSPLASQNFTAVATCSNGSPCPSGIGYTWSLTNGLGTLNSTTGNPVTFTAGSVDGIVNLFANATLYGTAVKSAPAPVNISGASLTAVAITPQSAPLLAGGTQVFNATPTCTSACPAGTVYTWNLTNGTLGTLNTTVGPSVTFTAGSTPGSLTLFATGTLNKVSAQSSPPAVITINEPTLISVSVSPTSAQLSPNGTQDFDATPACSAACPAGTRYLWTLTNSGGTINSTTGPYIQFTAGPTGGTDTLFVNASLNGVTMRSSPIAITLTGPVITLVSVVTNPAAPTLLPGGKQSFTAIPTCNIACPVSVVYAWTLTDPSKGTLNMTTGSSVGFTAGATPGEVGLFVNATLNGGMREGSSLITLATSPPTLTSVFVNPSKATVAPDMSQLFTAHPTCSTTCPSGITYSWALTSNIKGSLNATTGPSVKFTARTPLETLGLFVNASLNGVKQGNSAQITITESPVATLSAVAITPGHVDVAIGSTQVFEPVPMCMSGGSSATCPSTGITYNWSLNSTDGSLSPTTGSSTRYTPGTSEGLVGLIVSATLNGITVYHGANITVTAAPSPSPSGTTGLPADWGFLFLGTLIAASALTIIIGVWRRRRRTAVWVEEDH